MSNTHDDEEASQSSESPTDTGMEAILWSSPKKTIAYQEARSTLEGQRATAQNIDQKGMRTTQFILAAAGAFASVIKLLSISVVSFWGYLSVVFGIIALGASLASFNNSRTMLGPDHEYLDWFASHDFENDDTTWEDELLYEMSLWIQQNTVQIIRSVRLLLVSNVALMSSVLSLVVGLSL